MTQPLSICPLTGNATRRYAMLPGGEYRIDDATGVIYLPQLPSLERMAAFVDEEYERGVYRDYVEARPLKLATARHRLGLIAPHTSGRRLLDVGCSAGFFMEAAVEAGFDVAGIELSPVAIGHAAPEMRSRIVQGDVNTLIGRDVRQFDVVTAFDIIEHTFDPRAFVADISRVLAPGGLLVVSTPDTGHWLRPVMRARWPMLQPDQHTYLFSRGAMRTLLVESGYTPLLLDTAHKTLTVDYLFGQLQQTNPILSKVLNTGKRIVPEGLRHRPIAVNIGEMFACARKN